MTRSRTRSLAGRLALGLAVAAAALAAPSCSSSEKPAADDGKLVVLCSFYPMYLFARTVADGAGDVDVRLMVPANFGCPHDYDPTPSDMKALADADVLVINGAGLEEKSFMERVRQANPKIRVIDTSREVQGIAFADGEHDEAAHGHEPFDAHEGHDHAAHEGHDHAAHDDHEGHDHAGHAGHDDGHEGHDHAAHDDHEGHDHAEHAGHDDGHEGHDHARHEGHAEEGHEGHDHEGGVNPHFFSSPRQAAAQVKALAEELAEVRPAEAERFEANAEAYRTKLLDLAERFEEAGKSLAGRRIVTMHEVFDYLARDAGLEVVATFHLGSGREPSSKQIRELIETVRETQVKAIFTEPQYPDAAAKTVAADTSAKVYSLDPVASGPTDPPANHYLRTMDANLEVLRKALGDKAE